MCATAGYMATAAAYMLDTIHASETGVTCVMGAAQILGFRKVS